MTAPQPTIIESFRVYLDTTDLSASSRKGMLSSLRRAVRDLSADDMIDPLVLTEYRRTLKQGTRNIHDAMWRHLSLMFAPHSITLAKSDRISHTRFVHPLYASVTLLGIVADYARLPALTWGDLSASPHATDSRIVAAAQRVWDFQTAQPDESGTLIVPHAPRMSDPLVPCGPSLAPLREWRLRYVVNSRQHASHDRPAIAALSELVEGLCWGGIDGVTLRWVVDPIMADPDAFLRSKGALTALEAALGPAKRGDVGATLHLLSNRLHGYR